MMGLSWVSILHPEALDKVPITADLDAGEREVLALGLQIPGSLVIIDERLGRRYAADLQLSFTGTLGILLRAKKEGKVSRVEPYLDRLNLQRIRLSANTRLAVLKQAGE